MPSRYYRRNFIKGYYYHIYNRGANKGVVFKDSEDYQVFIDILKYYLTYPIGKPLSIINRIERKFTVDESKVPNLANNSVIRLCEYCLMPNHFHLLIKQASDPIKDCNIPNLMRRITITFAMYYTNKYKHSGTIFQGKYKNVLVDSDIQLQQLSKYIHRNPIEIQGSEPLHNYKYSSYRYYIGQEVPPEWININDIISFFSRPNLYQSYQKFVEEENWPMDNIKNIILE